MRRFVLVLVAAAVVTPAALAKGPSQAAVTGPGLGSAFSFTGNGEAEGTVLADVTEYTGFFPATFGQSPDPMLRGRPTGKLGPRYAIRYVVPGPNGKTYRLTQDLYPYAQGGAVTYMKAGQPIFGTGTRGGWYRTDPALKQLLVREGLPRAAPSSSAGSSGSDTAMALGIGAPVAILLAGAAALLARRRLVHRR